MCALADDFPSTILTTRIDPQQTNIEVVIPVLDDERVEDMEQFNMTLVTNEENVVFGPMDHSTINIVDNDGWYSVSLLCIILIF